MTKQELLTKLATECSTWDEAGSMEVHFQCITENGFTKYPGFSKDDWLAERERLLNKPSWDEIPAWVNSIAINKNKEWWGYNKYSVLNIGDSIMCDWVTLSKVIAIPAGYNWEQSLEERPV